MAHAARKRRRSCLPLVLLAVCSAAPAAAQTVEDFRSQATLRAGPLYLKPSFRIERLGVESNVFYEPAPKRDFVVSVAPQVEAWLPLYRRAYLSATVVTSADWYRRFVGERSFNPVVRSRVVLPWRRVTFTAGGEWLRTRRRPDFEINLRSNRFARQANASVSVQVLSRLWLELEAQQRTVGFRGDAFLEGTYLSETLNRTRRAAVASLRWRPTALTTLVLASELREVRFSRSPERNSDNVVVTAGVDFHPRALISGSARIGVRRFLARGAGVSDITAVVGEADLAYRIAGRTTVTLSGERDVNYSFERASPYFVRDSYALALRRQLGPVFDLGGRALLGHYAYQTAGRGSDVRWNAAAEFGYRPSPGIRAGLEAGWFRSRSATRARRRFRGFMLGFVFNYDL